MTRAIHFHSSDTRFCGSTEEIREFTLDPNAVTCRCCMSRDRLWITPQAAEYLRSIGYGSDVDAGRPA